MRRTHKKILGFFGLVLVAVMTFFAACLPSATTSATSTMVDTITVYVPSGVSDVNITKPSSGETTTSPTIELGFSYAKVDNVTLTLIKTDLDGETHEYPLRNYTFTDEAGTEAFTLDFNDANFGYGEYVLVIRGSGAGGATDEDSISFSHVPVVAEVSEDEDTGNIVVNLDYEPDGTSGDGSVEGNGDVAEIEINIYDKDGNLVEELSPIVITPPQTEVEIPFAEHNLPSGEYTIKVTAKDKNGSELYTKYTTYAVYEAVPVPNTGGLFKNLNISQTDYLITGVIVFMLAGIFGVVFIAKRQRKSGRRH